MKIRLDYVTPDYSSSPGETETLGIEDRYIDK